MSAIVRRPGRRPWMLPAAVAGVALVVGLMCGGLLFNTGTETRPEPQPAETASPQPAAGHADQQTNPPPAPSEPPPPSTPATGGILPPSDLAFVEVAGVRLPASASAGPWHFADGLARGFSPDAAGAALAAAHILVRVHPEVGADVFGPTLAAQVVGPHAPVLRTNVEHAYGQLLNQWPVVYGQPVGRLEFAVPGFRVDEFTGEEATVHLLLEVADGHGVVLGATTLRMRWHDGDWALVAPEAGAFSATWLVEDTTGFTLWRPGAAP